MSIRILVCGSGSIGIRHIRNILMLGHEVYVWRYGDKVRSEFAGHEKVSFSDNLDAALDECDAVVIATSTDSHIDMAKKAVSKGKHIFIEKPISNTLDSVETLRQHIKQKNLVAEVGCQLRFNPGLRILKNLLDEDNKGPLYAFQLAVGQRLDQWRPGTDYKKCYSADKNRGGGALFDLIHEIDLVLWLLGPVKEVTAIQSNVSDLEIDADDLTNMSLIMENGGVGQVQMDMVSPVYRRHCELVFRNCIYKWDYVTGRLSRSSRNKEEFFHSNPADFDRNTMFIDHMKHFIDQVGSGTRNPACSFDDGIAALKIALTAAESGKSNKTMKVID